MAAPTMATKTDTDGERIKKKKLFGLSMRGEWDEVVKMYKDDAWAHKAKITRSGSTALHIAVSDGKEDIVEQLVTHISNNEESKATVLKIANERHNTALHLAASMGNARMCECIAGVDSKLVGERNLDGETPLFLAALHGRKDAFLCLHSKCSSEPNKGLSYCRRKDGETILQCAIAGDYFDLAYQIIFLYGDLVNYVNEEGITPLHLLASKPSAFRSGSHLSWWNKVIYHCIFVDELKQKEWLKTSEDEKEDNFLDKRKYPENYHTCINFFKELRRMIKVPWGMIIQADHKKHGDTENPETKHHETTKKDGDAKNSETKDRDDSGHDTLPKHPKTQVEDPLPERGGHQPYPSNYDACVGFCKVVSKAMLVILGLGSAEISKIQNKKEKHIWSVQIMHELLGRASMYEYEDDGKDPQQTPSLQKPDETVTDETTPYAAISSESTNPHDQLNKEKITEEEIEEGSAPIAQNKPEVDLKPALELKLSTNSGEWLHQASPGGPWAQLLNDNSEKKILNLGIVAGEKKSPYRTKRETPILIAAKHGVTEMVEKILELFPVAIHDMNSEKKNVVLLAVENRQPHVYQLLLKKPISKESVFHKVDNKGNSALHLAAMQGEFRPWLIPGAALQMQWEIKWYEFVKNSMSPHFFLHYNKDGNTPKSVFTDTHKELVKNGGEWLTNTSQSCSVVAALIATVAFATAATVPGGVNQNNGLPTLDTEPAFNIFAISSLVALCFSVTALVMFLSILTSRYQEKDFGHDLPTKLLVGLTSLFVSIASMLISFCAGHFFLLKQRLQYAAFPLYGVTCLPVTLFAIAQFSLYFDLIRATFKKVPKRSYQVVSHL